MSVALHRPMSRTQRRVESPRVIGAPTFPYSRRGLEVHLDAARTDIIGHTAGAVSLIPDTSGKSNDGTQPDGARQPITGTHTINGLNVLRFLSDQLIVPNNTNDDMEIYMVAHVVTGSGGNSQWWGNGGFYDSEEGGGTADFGTSIQTNGQLGFGFGPGAAGGDSTSKTAGSVLGAPHLFHFTREAIAADVRQIRVDQSLEFDGTTGNRRNTRNSVRRTIGSIQTNGNYMPEMLFAELLVYSEIHTPALKQHISNNLMGKWGLL